MIDLDRFVLNRRRIRVARQTLIVLDAHDDLKRHLVIARHVRDQLLCAAHFFFDEPAHARLGMTIEARGFCAMRRSLPRLVMKIHFVACVAKPGLRIDPLKTCRADDQNEESDYEQPH